MIELTRLAKYFFLEVTKRFNVKRSTVEAVLTLIPVEVGVVLNLIPDAKNLLTYFLNFFWTRKLT